MRMMLPVVNDTLEINYPSLIKKSKAVKSKTKEQQKPILQRKLWQQKTKVAELHDICLGLQYHFWLNGRNPDNRVNRGNLKSWSELGKIKLDGSK